MTAIVDAPSGLSPAESSEGRIIKVMCSQAEDNFVGQAVDLHADGSNASTVVTGGDVYRPGELAEVTAVGTGDNPIFGVIVGFDLEVGIGVSSYYHVSGGADRVAEVIECYPNLNIFGIQGDGSGSMTPAAIGLNANLVSNDLGNSATGRSIAELDETTPSDSNNDMQLKIRQNRAGFVSAGPDDTGANAKYLVSINNCRLANILAGV